MLINVGNTGKHFAFKLRSRVVDTARGCFAFPSYSLHFSSLHIWETASRSAFINMNDFRQLPSTITAHRWGIHTSCIHVISSPPRKTEMVKAKVLSWKPTHSSAYITAISSLLMDSCQRFIEKFDEFCSFNSTHVSALMLNVSQKKFRKLSLHKSHRKLTASKMCCSISVVEKNLPKGEYSAKIEVSQNVSFTN